MNKAANFSPQTPIPHIIKIFIFLKATGLLFVTDFVFFIRFQVYIITHQLSCFFSFTDSDLHYQKNENEK